MKISISRLIFFLSLFSSLCITNVFADCVISPINGKTYCGTGKCQVDAKTGVVYCSPYRFGGALIDFETGAVLCGVGSCEYDRNTDQVYCSYHYFGDAKNNKLGEVICTDGSGRGEWKKSYCKLAKAMYCEKGR